MTAAGIRQSTICAALWVGLHAIHIYAFNYSGRPNQIFWSYALLFASYAVLVSVWQYRVAVALTKLVALHLLYFAAFVLVSRWELVPGTSARHLPFIALDWIILAGCFAVGYRLTQVQVVTAHVVLAWFIVVLTICQWMFTPDATRFGYGPSSMLLLVLLVAFDRNVAAVSLGIAMAGSNHVTPLAAGTAGLLAYVLLYYRGNALRAMVEKRRLLAVVMLVPLVIALSIERTTATFSRLSTLGDDRVRDYIVQYSGMLLRESQLRGIGYMNFYAWSGLETGYRAEERTGAEILGFNLHNSYMTWALEGGVLVSLIVLILVWLTLKRVHRIAGIDRRMGTVLYSWFVVFAIFAAFHQLHIAIQFWGVIGLTWGMVERLSWQLELARRQYMAADEPQPA